MERETLTLPRMPEGSPDDLKLKRDLAVASLALKKKCTLQEAADQLDGILDRVETSIQQALRG